MIVLQFWRWTAQSGFILKDIAKKPLELKHWRFLVDHGHIKEIFFGWRNKRIFDKESVFLLHDWGYAVEHLGEYHPTEGDKKHILYPNLPNLCECGSEIFGHYQQCYSCHQKGEFR